MSHFPSSNEESKVGNGFRRLENVGAEKLGVIGNVFRSPEQFPARGARRRRFSMVEVMAGILERS